MNADMEDLTYRGDEVEKWLESWAKVVRGIEEEWKELGELNDYRGAHLDGQRTLLRLLLEDLREGDI